MRIRKAFSFAVIFGLVESTLTSNPAVTVKSSQGKSPLINTASVLQNPARNGLHNLTIPSLSDYPLDPYQMRVPGTTTSLIFSKYGPPIYHETFLNLIAKAQYDIIRTVMAAHGDGPVSQANLEWSEKKVYLRISRPLAQDDLTWVMVADTLDGIRGFFDGLRGWFETEITILDDTAGPVGRGSLLLW